MRKIVVSAVGVAVSMLLGSNAVAQDWVVGKVSGKAWMSANGAAPTLLAPGMAVSQGSTISTGPDGRALLVHGQDMVTVGPKSALSVQAGAGAQRTTVLQKSGRITVDVETQNAPHFTVETPFMAAVVKGTRFDVQVSQQGANVNVQRGRVQVADFATGQTADIHAGAAGQRARRRNARPEPVRQRADAGRAAGCASRGCRRSRRRSKRGCHRSRCRSKRSSSARRGSDENVGFRQHGLWPRRQRRLWPRSILVQLGCGRD